MKAPLSDIIQLLNQSFRTSFTVTAQKPAAMAIDATSPAGESIHGSA
ncbi:MAG TPA: hypothetical protein VLT37_06040 [Acidocella sp.]|nr:hypothetical protein [Acidocella sp.]